MNVFCFYFDPHLTTIIWLIEFIWNEIFFPFYLIFLFFFFLFIQFIKYRWKTTIEWCSKWLESTNIRHDNYNTAKKCHQFRGSSFRININNNLSSSSSSKTIIMLHYYYFRFWHCHHHYFNNFDAQWIFIPTILMHQMCKYIDTKKKTFDVCEIIIHSFTIDHTTYTIREKIINQPTKWPFLIFSQNSITILLFFISCKLCK